MTASWCILQMSGPRTLAVVRSLRADGIEVWAPTGMQRRMRPRSTKYRDAEVPLLTGLAFAPYEDAPRLNAIRQSHEHDHPAFSLLMHHNAYGKVAARDLEPLHQFEAQAAEDWRLFVEAEARAKAERARRKKGRKRGTGRAKAARSYVLGQKVKVEMSAFQGLIGKVIHNRRNGEMVISFGGLLGEITVEACDVNPVHVEDAKSEQTKAA